MLLTDQHSLGSIQIRPETGGELGGGVGQTTLHTHHLSDGGLLRCPVQVVTGGEPFHLQCILAGMLALSQGYIELAADLLAGQHPGCCQRSALSMSPSGPRSYS